MPHRARLSSFCAGPPFGSPKNGTAQSAHTTVRAMPLATIELRSLRAPPRKGDSPLFGGGKRGLSPFLVYQHLRGIGCPLLRYLKKGGCPLFQNSVPVSPSIALRTSGSGSGPRRMKLSWNSCNEKSPPFFAL